MDTVVRNINIKYQARISFVLKPIHITQPLHRLCNVQSNFTQVFAQKSEHQSTTHLYTITESKLRCSEVTLKLWIKFTHKCTSAVQWPECRDFVRDSSIAALALWSIELEPFLGSYTKPPSSQFRLLIKISNFEQDWKRAVESWQKREKWPWASQPHFLGTATVYCVLGKILPIFASEVVCLNVGVNVYFG